MNSVKSHFFAPLVTAEQNVGVYAADAELNNSDGFTCSDCGEFVPKGDMRHWEVLITVNREGEYKFHCGRCRKENSQ